MMKKISELNVTVQYSSTHIGEFARVTQGTLTVTGYGYTRKQALSDAYLRLSEHHRQMADTGRQHGPEEAPALECPKCGDTGETDEKCGDEEASGVCEDFAICDCAAGDALIDKLYPTQKAACPICKGSGYRFSAYFCTCEIGREKLGETISAKKLDLDATKEAFHISRAETGDQHGPEEKEKCFCQYGLMYDEIDGEAYACTEPGCAAGARQEAAEQAHFADLIRHAVIYEETQAAQGW